MAKAKTKPSTRRKAVTKPAAKPPTSTRYIPPPETFWDVEVAQLHWSREFMLCERKHWVLEVTGSDRVAAYIVAFRELQSRHHLLIRRGVSFALSQQEEQYAIALGMRPEHFEMAGDRGWVIAKITPNNVCRHLGEAVRPRRHYTR